MFALLTCLACALAGGIAVGEWAALPAATAAAWAAAAALGLWLARRRHRGVLGATLALTACAGALAVAGARPRAPPGLLDGQPWDIDGEVRAAPERGATAVHVPVALVAVTRAGQRRAARGDIDVRLDAPPLEPLLPGDHVRLRAELRSPRGFANPGALDGARAAAANGVIAVASVRAPVITRMAEPVSPGPLRAVAALRARLGAAVASTLDGEARALVASLVLGDRGDVTPALDDAFRQSGVSHVLSVSGLHLAIAAFLFYVGLRRLLVRIPALAARWPVRRWAALAALPATVLYTLVTGAAVATVRACLVAALWLLGVALGRHADARATLALAGLAILGVAPLALFDASFQLSFAAAAGTLLLAPRWTPRFTAGMGGMGRTRAWRLAAWAARLTATSAAALAATAPIGAWHFAQLAPAGLVANLVVVPLAELGVVPVGLAGAVLAAAHLPGGRLLLVVAGALARAMAAAAAWFATRLPAWHVPAPTALEIGLWYAALTVAAAAPRPRWLLVGLVAAFALALGGRLGARRLSTTLTATFLDVGQGDACVVELPHGKVLVVDGGGSFDPGFDPGRQVIAPFLWRRGIGRIDLLVLSHPHPDHANGLPFLASEFDVGELWTNGAESEQPGTVALRAVARRRGIPEAPPRPLDLGGARVTPLAPFDATGALATDAAEGDNDNSLVIAVDWRGRRVLFAGDLERDGEAALVARLGDRLGADVLKVPHHGSKTSSTAPFLDAVHPAHAVISVGVNNRWGFPHPGVLGRYRRRDARVWRTDRDGAVTLTIDGHGRIAAAGVR